MTPNRVRIGVACPIPGERATFLEWLKDSEYEPVPMLNIDSVGTNTRPIEVLIADVSLVPAAALPRVVKTLGPNRPLVLVGNPEQRIEDVPRDATWVARPVTRDNLTMSIALALAEGRPARRSPRTVVPRLMSSVDGVASKIVDVSAEGVRLEINGSSTSVLPPYFTLRVPGFGINAKVKRVWVATPSYGLMWCGGIIEKRDATAVAWNRFLQNAPAGNQITEFSVV